MSDADSEAGPNPEPQPIDWRYDGKAAPGKEFSARGVAAGNLADLAKRLGVPLERLGRAVMDPEQYARQVREQQRREANKRANTPEAIRKRTEFDPFTGR